MRCCRGLHESVVSICLAVEQFNDCLSHLVLDSGGVLFANLSAKKAWSTIRQLSDECYISVNHSLSIIAMILCLSVESSSSICLLGMICCCLGSIFHCIGYLILTSLRCMIWSSGTAALTVPGTIACPPQLALVC